MANKVEIVIDGKNKAGPAFKEADKQLGGISSQAKAAGAAIASVLAAGAFSGFIKDSIDAADAAGKSAQATGLAVEEYTALKFAAEMADVSVGKLDGALGKFNKTIDKAGQGGKAQLEAFSRLGISVRDAEGNVKSTGALLAEVADKFQQLPDGVQKSALAMELFGKSGTAMIPMLNAGSEGLDEMRKMAEELGLVLSKQQTEDADAFNDSLDLLGKVSDGAANKLSGDLLPALNDLTGLMIDLNKNTGAGTIIADALGFVLKGLSTIVLYLGTGFVLLGNTIGASAAAVYEAAKGNFSEAADIFRQLDKENTATAAASEARIKGLWDGSTRAIAQAAVDTKKAYQKSLKDQKSYVEQSKTNSDKLLKDAEAAIKANQSLQKKAQSDLKKLQDEKLAIEAKYAASKAGAGGAVDPTYGNAQQLKINARDALRAGDVEGAKSAADQALKVLEALEAAGGNGYGLRGFKDELMGIEQAAADIEINQKVAESTVLAAQLSDLEAKAQAVNDALKLTPVLDEGAVALLNTKLQALATALGQTLTIPVQMVAVAPAGLATNTAPGDPGVPGFSGGGRIRGKGTGTSDSILARLSNGEFVMRAAAVRKYGPDFMAKLNGLRLPGYASGGLIGAAMSAPVGQSGRDLGRVDLNLPGGETISLLADQQNFTDLVKRQSWKRGSTRR